jgi:hypothetical protein
MLPGKIMLRSDKIEKARSDYPSGLFYFTVVPTRIELVSKV